jgi:hypothetical protein
MAGFEPGKRLTITAHTDDPGYNDPNWENSVTLTVRPDGTLDFQRFHFGGVGYYVWITADGAESGRYRWERG